MADQGYYTNLMRESENVMNFEDLSSMPEEHESPPNVDSTSQGRPLSRRTKNFSEDEDKLLVSAWLNISIDPIHGNNQKNGTFWDRVHDYYHTNKEFESDRNLKSLSHRWSTIQDNVSKFSGCMKQIEGRNQSGTTHYDKIEHAKSLFKAQATDHKKEAMVSLMHVQSI